MANEHVQTFKNGAAGRQFDEDAGTRPAEGLEILVSSVAVAQLPTFLRRPARFADRRLDHPQGYRLAGLPAEKSPFLVTITGITSQIPLFFSASKIIRRLLGKQLDLRRIVN